MPITQVRVQNFKAFEDSGPLNFGPLTTIVGPNDAGKSAILHALRVFFEPPKKGGLPLEELHAKDPSRNAKIELVLDPAALQTTKVKVDAKNDIDLVKDCLVDAKGFLRLRLTLSLSSVGPLEMLISDIDDDDLFPLALKRQDELVALLRARGLEAKKSGDITNQQRRSDLRAHATAADIGRREEWVDASSIEKPLREVLPTFLFFTDVSDFSIGITSVQNQFRGVVDRALATHAAAAQLEADIRATVQAEFDKVQGHLTHLTPAITSLQADPKVNWKKAVESISLQWSDQAGLELPYELRGAGTRRLFMVAYFQYEAAESIRIEGGPRYVFAIEEPEIHLHPGAQRVLSAALSELASLGHSVVFTTHSPVFAALAPTDSLVLVTRQKLLSTARQAPQLDAVQVARELGVEATDRLIGRDYVILVEGKTDVAFYEAVLQALFADKLTGLDPAKVMFLQCGGIGNLRFVATKECIAAAGLKWAAIADSDRMAAGTPPGSCQQTLAANPPKTCCQVSIIERTSIENYLHPKAIKAVTLIDCLMPPYGRPTALNGKPLAKPEWDKIKESAPAIAAAMSSADHVASSIGAKGKSEWIELFGALKASFGL